MNKNVIGKLAVFATVLAVVTATNAAAEDCSGNPNAIGTSRVLAVNTKKVHQVGTLTYSETLPLNDHEIVLTFDDGPIIPYTEQILDTLASECAKATFFILGDNARESPDILQRVYKEGHSLGSHTERHTHLGELSIEGAKSEFDTGVATITAALGSEGKLSPFFRAPYLEQIPEFNVYLRSKGVMLWGIDFQADDWLNIGPEEVLNRALKRIEEKKRGILLLHDIQAVTTKVLPKLLQELKKRNYHIVHVVAEEVGPTGKVGTLMK